MLPTRPTFRRTLLLLLGCAALPVQARAEPPALVAPGKLSYGVAATFAPFEFTRDGQLTGFDVELGAALAAKLGLAPAPLNIEFRGLIPALQGRRVDVINSAMYINPARSEQVDFVPYMRIGQQLVVRKGNPAGITGRDGLCGHSIAVTLGGIEETYARQDAEKCQAAGRPALSVLTFPSAQDAALTVRQGRADAYSDSTAGVARVETELPDVFEPAGPVFETGTQIGMAVRKGDTAMADTVRGALRQVVADGTYAQLMQKYKLPAEGSLF